MFERLSRRETAPIQRAYEMKFGTQITASGVRFRLWAPLANSVGLQIDREPIPRPMRRRPRGWFELEVDGAGHGTRYGFILDDGAFAPDPASRFQPDDVAGQSEVIDPRRYPWRDIGWAGRPWEEAVLYELHVGTFTPQGTFAAAAEKLDYLQELEVTAVQLMPVNDFPGRWNWGYDGVLPFAPDATYGRPEDFKAFIDAAHERSIMVLLDVIYNHFGPKGNFLPRYAPVLTDRHQTPWGAALNFDGAGSEMVRDLMIANARFWLTEYHLDGLRLDAVHEIKDEGYNHLLHDLALQIRGATDGRYTHLVVENENNDADWLRRTEDGRAGLYDAQWNDDVHHLIDVAILGAKSNYRADYEEHPERLPRALATGFGFQGEVVPTRHAPKGQPSGDLPPTAFISFIQNHDQIGNRLFGERIASLVDERRMRVAVALYLLAPQVPLLFMGEEWGAETPFLYFNDVDRSFRDDIIAQRQKQFGQFVAEANRDREVPDPMAETTFAASKLDWPAASKPEKQALLEFYRTLLGIRARHIIPLLAGVGGNAGCFRMVGAGFAVEWRLAGGHTLRLAANLTGSPAGGFELASGRRLWLEGEADDTTLGPWSLVFSLIGPPATK